MKLDANLLRYLTRVEWRVLISIEMGMKNHEYVPDVLISKIANLRRHGINKILSSLLSNKLIAHNSQAYNGYKLTYLGYDFLALKTFSSRKVLAGVGMRMGVGKESDIHICEDCNNNTIILKLHRLGRVSFRSIKRNRDYLGKRNHASWLYMARLAATKEFAYLKALYAQGFPVPKPIDVNRHGILMEYVKGYPMAQVRELKHPKKVMGNLMQLIVSLAEAGVIHGDFNEFNIMINDKENITLIDFPQCISTRHPNAAYYFDRDIKCIQTLFSSRFRIDIDECPKFEDIQLPEKEFILGHTEEEENILQNLIKERQQQNISYESDQCTQEEYTDSSTTEEEEEGEEEEKGEEEEGEEGEEEEEEEIKKDEEKKEENLYNKNTDIM